ncbi:MAG: 2-C-methyl-D-erythritol 4-phosphate cytidylyltransferase [candidate division Zixibacteria bacterium]
MKTRRNMAILVAAGEGNRMESELPKQFMDLAGKPIAAHSLTLFERSALIDEIILVVSEDYLTYSSQELVDKFAFKKIHKITTGGETRQESVFAGLSACPPTSDLVVIHDTARPLLTLDLLERSINKAAETNAAILAVSAKDSMKLGDGENVLQTLKRDTVWIAQTPQVFKFESIFDAHKRAEVAEYEATDDSELYEKYRGKVAIVRGSYNNFKITTPGDLILAREILRGMK